MGKGRAPCCDKNQVKRGPWSPAEDLRLITFIQNHGHDNWRALPKQAGLLRCGKSCRLRWINYLRPDVKRGNFTQDEEDTIIKLHKTWGNKWSKIASRLPGRTDNEIKNVWNTHLKKRLLQSPEETTKVVASDSSGDESKEPSSPTTSSSSSSSQTQNSDKSDKPPNNQQPEQQTSSSISSESSNSSTTPPDIFWPQNPVDSHPVELDMGIEIPLECDIEFWNMLDLDNIDHLLESSNEVAHGCAENSGELQNDKWFKYLETELGLDRPPEVDTDETMATTMTTTTTTTVEINSANSAQRLLVDPCIAYFADGLPNNPTPKNQYNLFKTT